MTKIAFLDRDGVLCASAASSTGTPAPPRSVYELKMLPRVNEACGIFREAGYLLVIATNQPDVARGTQTREAVEAINARVAYALGVDEVHVCWHDDADNCSCRKPQPGMLLDTMSRLDAAPADCVMVGDRWRDVEAGKRAGCRVALVGDGHGEPFPTEPDFRVADLWEAALVFTGTEDAS